MGADTKLLAKSKQCINNNLFKILTYLQFTSFITNISFLPIAQVLRHHCVKCSSISVHNISLILKPWVTAVFNCMCVSSHITLLTGTPNYVILRDLKRGSWTMWMEKHEQKTIVFLAYVFSSPNASIIVVNSGYHIITFQWKYALFWKYWSAAINKLFWLWGSHNIWFVFGLKVQIYDKILLLKFLYKYHLKLLEIHLHFFWWYTDRIYV